MGRSEVRTHNILRRPKKKGKKEDKDFVFLDRKSLILNTDEVRQFPEARHLMNRETSPNPERALTNRMQELEVATEKPASSRHRKVLIGYHL